MKGLRKIKFELAFLVLFSAMAFVFLACFYNNHLYRLEQLQLFQLSLKYILDHLLVHGGISIWIAEFFTQFFHLPGAGALIITLSLMMLYLATKNILLRISANDSLLFLTFLPVIGYAILMLSDLYSYSGMIGLLISILFASLYLSITKINKRITAGVLLILLTYWITGAAYLVFTSIIILVEISNHLKKREKAIPLWSVGLFLLLALIFPLLVRRYLILDTSLQAYISEAYFQIRIFFPMPLVLIFASFPCLVVIQCFLAELIPGKYQTVTKSITLLLTPILVIWGISDYADFSAERDFKYDNLVYYKQWERIIQVAKKNPPESRTEIVALNLAFANTGQLTSQMFNFEQDENCFFIPFDKRGMTRFISGEPYYYLGLTNFAQLFAMETIESSPDARFPSRSFRRVAETYIINSQFDLAYKYLEPLSHTLFYGRWAKERMRLLNNENDIKNLPEYHNLKGFQPVKDFYFDEKQIPLALRFLLDANPGNKMAYEYLMAEYLLKKDFNGFLHYIKLAYSMDYKEMPITFQEAALFINSIAPQTPDQLINFPVKSNVLAGFNYYRNMYTTAGIDNKDKLKKEFGNTYWYYIHFK